MFRHFITALASLLAAFALNAFAAVEANQANQAELEAVKGIGPSLSNKILEARKAGSFKDWNDMVERVSGVGPGNAARFSQAGLTVGGTVYDKGAAAASSTSAAPADQPKKRSTSSRRASVSAAPSAINSRV